MRPAGCGRAAGGGPGRRELPGGPLRAATRRPGWPGPARGAEEPEDRRGQGRQRPGGARSSTRLRSACRTLPPAPLQMAVWGPGCEAEVLHMHEGAGRGGAALAWAETPALTPGGSDPRGPAPGVP